MSERIDVLDRFQPTGAGNVYLDCGEFGISFNPSPGMGWDMFAGDDDSAETAIVLDGRFFILNGDFRREYAALVDEGIEGCLRFFASKPEFVSSWSASTKTALSIIGGAK